MSRQFIPGPHIETTSFTHTPTGNSKISINLTCIFLDYGRKLQNLKGTHTELG